MKKQTVYFSQNSKGCFDQSKTSISFSGEIFKVGTGGRAVMVAALLLAASYLSSQSPFFDLGDVGVCRVQLVKIHLAELVVELLQKLPGQVVVAANRNG